MFGVTLRKTMSKNIEKVWTDDSIRWLDTKKESTEDEQDDSGAFLNIFDDSAMTFRFEFYHPRIKQTKMKIHLKGYKNDSHETYKSTGLTIWRAAESLCHYLIQQHEMLQDKNILELGAGLGLCGILVQSIALKSRVYITDGDTETLVKLRENIIENKMETVYCRQLLWGRKDSEEFLKFSDGELFDVIIASDIIYSPVVVEPLWQSIEVLLKNNGTFITAFCKRKVPVTIKMFLEAAGNAGFVYECVGEESIGETSSNAPEVHVWIYSFRRKIGNENS